MRNVIYCCVSKQISADSGMLWQRNLKILQILHRSLHKAILGHIQVGIDFHGCTNTGVANGFGEGGQIEIRIVFVLDVIVGHVGMAKSVHGHIVG